MRVCVHASELVHTQVLAFAFAFVFEFDLAVAVFVAVADGVLCSSVLSGVFRVSGGILLICICNMPFSFLGLCTVVDKEQGIFTRPYTKMNVTLNCPSWTSTFSS